MRALRESELANAVVKALSDKNSTVATAESCTGGLVSAELTKISGSSNIFEYGIIAYANRIKEAELAVSSKSLAEFGAVSSAVAIQMAEGVKKKGKADFGLATTGIAGPTGGTADKPVGTVYIAVASSKETRCVLLSLGEECGNDRELIRERTVCEVLKLLLDLI